MLNGRTCVVQIITFILESKASDDGDLGSTGGNALIPARFSERQRVPGWRKVKILLKSVRITFNWSYTCGANRQSKCVWIVASNKNTHKRQTSIVTANCLRWHRIDKEGFVDEFIWSCYKLWSSFCLWALCCSKNEAGAAMLPGFSLRSSRTETFGVLSGTRASAGVSPRWASGPRINPHQSFCRQPWEPSLLDKCEHSVSLYGQGEVRAVPTFSRSDQHRPRSRWLWHVRISSAEDELSNIVSGKPSGPLSSESWRDNE